MKCNFPFVYSLCALYQKNSTIRFSIFLISLFLLPLSCSTSKKLVVASNSELRATVEKFVACYNNRDEQCLNELYDPAYQSLSPIISPEEINTFIKQSLENFEKNDFEIKVQIKEIETGSQLAHVALRWTIDTKNNSTSKNPYVDVDRIDIWRKKGTDQWRLFRTVIYQEQQF